ncbi:FAD-dependent oxidoreductase [Natribaculum luteum]|uniref:FAD-dependent oxidoreductase n=1 Tax=Natribaculum luteum TaxID=1586232 RepID=A0ABD5P3W8_9EURY|nr:FAD-dependent oxidoreductase [Natribaculum luteum]
MDGTEVTVETVREVGTDTVALELTTPEEFDALPGQFVLLGAEVDGEEVTRHYTLSSPSVGEAFEITVGVDPEGDLSPWLASLEGGETVGIEGPFGRITYERDADVVAVAGGPGVGPAVAIAEAAREAGYDAAVVYQDDEPAHRTRLEALEDAGADVTVVDEGDDERLAAAVGERLEDGQFYVFGFSDFVEAVADAIEEAGGDPDDALIENFG